MRALVLALVPKLPELRGKRFFLQKSSSVFLVALVVFANEVRVIFEHVCALCCSVYLQDKCPAAGLLSVHQ